RTDTMCKSKPQSSACTQTNYDAYYTAPYSLANLILGMTGGSVLSARALGRKFPWRDYRTIMDIGTAQGCLPVQIAMARPHLTGGGFDLPPLKPYFERYVGAHGLSERLAFTPGDFFRDALP